MQRQSLRWVSLALVLGVAACNPGGGAQDMVEEAIEAETGGEVDLDAEEGTVTLRGEDGDEMTFTSNEEGIELPDDFPSHVPVHPDARPTQYASIAGAVQAGFRIDAALTDVRDWYVEQLEEGDWTVQMNAVMSEGGLLVAELGDETLSLMMSAEEGETMLMITLGRD
jgi:hypothetical protein